MDRYRKDKGITVTGNDIPKPITSFSRANFPGTKSNGFLSPNGSELIH